MTGFIKRYNNAVWVGFAGQIFSQLGNFIVYPFLVLYLRQQIRLPLVLTMAIVGLSPLAALVSTYFSGPLSDRVGRKPIMMVALIGQAMAIIAFSICTTPWAFAGVSLCDGLFGAMYLPTVNAFVGDLVTGDHQLTEVFSLYHMALNFGGAVGPILGAYAFSHDPRVVFWGSAGFILLAALFIAVFTKETTAVRATREQPPVPHEESRARDVLIICLVTVLALPVALLYAQVKTNLPLHLAHHFQNYLHVYTTMLVFNAACVAVLQFPATRLSKNVKTDLLLAVSFAGFAIVCIGYAMARSIQLLLLTEFVFTLAEMIGIPQMNTLIMTLAPASKRGLYASIFELRWVVGEIIGPVLGATVMTSVGGSKMFLFLGGVIAVCAIPLLVLVKMIRQTKLTNIGLGGDDIVNS